MSESRSASDDDSMLADAGQLPSDGVVVLNRQGKEVFRFGLDPPETQRTAIDLERLKSLILQPTAVPAAGHISVRICIKHAKGESHDSVVNYNEVWDPKKPGQDENMPDLGTMPDDDVSHTKEPFLLLGMLSDDGDHSNDVYLEYGCPLKRRFLIILYLPAGIAWADLEGLVTDFSGDGTSMSEIQDRVKNIEYVRPVIGEWLDPLKLRWINEDGEAGHLKVCRILMERFEYQDAWEPWSDMHDDGASNLRTMEIVYHSLTAGERPEREEIADKGARQGGLTRRKSRKEVDEMSWCTPAKVQPDLFIARPRKNCDAMLNSILPTASLLSAVCNGDTVAVKQLLDQGVDTSVTGGLGRTLLAIAAKCGHTAVVELLIERTGMSLDVPNQIGETALVEAAQFGQYSAAKLLLEHGADINSDLRNGYTPLVAAAQNGHESVVRLLLSQEGLKVSGGPRGWNALASAAAHDRVAVVKLLVEVDGIDINAFDKQGVTALSRAATCGHVATVKLLLTCPGIDVNLQESSGFSALLYAAFQGHKSVAKVLLERKDINVNTMDTQDQTPLWWAAHLGHKSVVELLLQHPDIDPNLKNASGVTPRAQAMQQENKWIVKLLSPVTSDS